MAKVTSITDHTVSHLLDEAYVATKIPDRVGIVFVCTTSNQHRNDYWIDETDGLPMYTVRLDYYKVLNMSIEEVRELMVRSAREWIDKPKNDHISWSIEL